jgi:iron(III) transport system ATP-binding protein
MTSTTDAAHSSDIVDAAPPATNAAASIVLRVEDVRKEFRRAGGGRVAAIDDLSLTVADGEIVVLLGPSGCGKTTLLRAVAGLERPDHGRILIDDQVVFSGQPFINRPPERRPVGMVFQQYALWPHMSVFQNVAYPLQARKVRRAEVKERVMAVLRPVGIEELADQHPGRISGGQQQRVALARAVVAGDRMVLFDEPLSNVDAKVRDRLRIELLEMHARMGFAALYVTHDQSEAMALANRIAVLSTGRIVQLGTPREVYDSPATRSVADFVGTSNEVPGRVVSVGAGHAVVDTERGLATVAATEPLVPGDQVVLVWRPERATLGTDRAEGGLRWDAGVVAEIFNGPSVTYVLSVGDREDQVTSAAPVPHRGSCAVFVPNEALRAFKVESGETEPAIDGGAP